MGNKELIDLENRYFVSVIMPTFNRKDSISNSIDSILNQTFKNFELIIVDDGSVDGTYEFVKNKYSKFIEMNKIKYYELDHNGVSITRNFGLSQSKGNIIAYLDSDNQWKVRYLEIMIGKLDSHKRYNCAYCKVQINDHVNCEKYVLSNRFDRERLLNYNFIDLNSFIHKRCLYESKGGFDTLLTRLVDWDLIIRYTENGNTPFFVNKVLVDYFIDSNLDNISLTESYDENRDIIYQKNSQERNSYNEKQFLYKRYKSIKNLILDEIFYHLRGGK